ncbi:MAG TPA: hypothetical protein DEF34_12170 [Desulfotomaculum sp.]|nr:MAG: hypothetical protein JL56_01895 [Desulfotomaculum sp. BICA1-6]HBX24370.1 hypothetical protein [Desulfotomaculum sp.]
MVFRLRHKNARKKAKKEVAAEREVVIDKPITERQDLKQILGNENANIESIRVRYDYEPAAELAPAINQTLQAESTKSLVEKAVNDTFLTGAVAGILGTIVLHILSFLWLNLGFINTTTMQVSGEIFLTPGQINTLAGFWVSIFVHFVVGSAGGVLLAYFMRFAGYDFYWIKGLALAGFMLLMGMGLVVNMMGIAPQMRHNAVGVLFHIISYIAYGLAVAYILYKFANIRKGLNN